MGIQTFPLVSRGALVALQWPKCDEARGPAKNPRNPTYVSTIISALTFGPHRLHRSHTPRAMHTSEENTSFCQATIVFSLTKRPPASAGFTSFGGRYIERKGQQQRCFKQSPRGDRGSWPFLSKAKRGGARAGKRDTTMAPTWRCAACIALVALVAGPAGRGAEAATKKSEEERRAEYERYVDCLRRGTIGRDIYSGGVRPSTYIVYIHTRRLKRTVVGVYCCAGKRYTGGCTALPPGHCCLSRKYTYMSTEQSNVPHISAARQGSVRDVGTLHILSSQLGVSVARSGRFGTSDKGERAPTWHEYQR